MLSRREKVQIFGQNELDFQTFSKQLFQYLFQPKIQVLWKFVKIGTLAFTSSLGSTQQQQNTYRQTFFLNNCLDPGELTTDIATENSIQNVLQLHYFLCTHYNSIREKVKKISSIIDTPLRIYCYMGIYKMVQK